MSLLCPPPYKPALPSINATWMMAPASGRDLIFHWTFTKLDYLNITIRLNTTMAIRTNCTKKPLNLYLYLPPHAAHPPEYSMLCRGHRLTTDPADCKAYLHKFYTRLCYRGYLKHSLLLLFEAGLANRTTKPPCQKKLQSNLPNDMLFLHIPFHLANPPLHLLQETYRSILLHPKGAASLPQIANNHFGINCGIQSMIILYHRQSNFANLL
jgi:hypothetical protein